MPIYEYRCSECGHELEALQKISDDPLKTCPACQQESLRKLVSAASFRLKGGGWYETDFKKGNKRHLADDGDKAAGKESNKESGKESATGKPATKTTTGEQKTAGSSEKKSLSPGKSDGPN